MKAISQGEQGAFAYPCGVCNAAAGQLCINGRGHAYLGPQRVPGERAVSCSKCGAGVGLPCVTFRGKRTGQAIGTYHGPRKDAAMALRARLGIRPATDDFGVWWSYTEAQLAWINNRKVSAAQDAVSRGARGFRCETCDAGAGQPCRPAGHRESPPVRQLAINDLACLYCGVLPGQPCSTADGKNTVHHIARVHAWHEAMGALGLEVSPQPASRPRDQTATERAASMGIRVVTASLQDPGSVGPIV